MLLPLNIQSLSYSTEQISTHIFSPLLYKSNNHRGSFFEMVQSLLSPTLYLTNMAQSVYQKTATENSTIMFKFRQWNILDQSKQILDQV